MLRPAEPRVLRLHCRRASPQLRRQRLHHVPAALARAWVRGLVLSAAKERAAAARHAAERRACVPQCLREMALQSFEVLWAIRRYATLWRWRSQEVVMTIVSNMLQLCRGRGRDKKRLAPAIVSPDVSPMISVKIHLFRIHIHAFTRAATSRNFAHMSAFIEREFTNC
jgi:hypothetical protein